MTEQTLPVPIECSLGLEGTEIYDNVATIRQLDEILDRWNALAREKGTWAIPAAMAREAAHHWALTHKMSDQVQWLEG